MLEFKELNFFSNEKRWVKGFLWYEKYFIGVMKICGEILISYI